MENLTEILATGGIATGGVGTVVWWLIKRLIARIDKLEQTITGEDGLSTKLAVNIANDKAFVARFEDHLKTHTGIKEEVAEDHAAFKKSLFEEMDQRYKRK